MSVLSRRLMSGLALGLLLSAGTLAVAHAQDQGQGGGDNDQAAKQKRDEEFDGKNLRMKEIKAEGPCPFVKVLYDAARYQEFKDNKESTQAAQWTGEINGIASDCAYKGTDPIKVAMDISFSLGRGDAAVGQSKVYHYWIAVTEKDRTVLAKQEFELPVTFADGEPKIDVNTRIEDIVIPRANITVAGSNFEVLVGFDVTPQMVEFNREGKHFRYVSPVEKKQPAQ